MPIGMDGLRERARVVYFKAVPSLLGARPHCAGHIGHGRGEVAGREVHHHLARLDLGKVQDVVDQLQQLFSVASHGRQEGLAGLLR